MEKTKKELTIEAFKELIVKHRIPDGRIFGDPEYCPLCKIHIVEDGYKKCFCFGCPLADQDGEIGCVEFKSYPSGVTGRTMTEEARAKLDHVAKLIEKYLPVIEQIPEERFTPEGWTYFHELDRND